MEKSSLVHLSPQIPKGRRDGWIIKAAAVVALILVVTIPQWTVTSRVSTCQPSDGSDGDHPQRFVTNPLPESASAPPYGQFPLPNDPFRFLPCTNLTLPPALNETNVDRTWAALYDPDPARWTWASPKSNATTTGDPYAGRAIYLCGFLDVPLDYTNKSDSRIARLAVTKLQVSGLARVDPGSPRSASAGQKSERTLVIEPGGPGGSGTSYAFRSAENITARLSGGKFDVLGWDPRGVNSSLPAFACFPHDVDRDHWKLLRTQHRAVSPSPKYQLELTDAMNNALFRACWERHGDLGRFIGTSFVARDMEEIRIALGEDELTGYLVSYGTGIGQTYAAMFPGSVGRMVLDGTEYVPDHRELGGFGWTALDNGTDAWNDGFLGECLNAGPEHCALAKPRDGKLVTLPDLKARMADLLSSLATRPIAGYTESSGPSLVTYSAIVNTLYGAMYNAERWPAVAKTLYELEMGNSTLAAALLERWEFDPSRPCSDFAKPSSDELFNMVVCADAYDAPQPDGLDWWLSLWANMTTKSWIAGNSRFYDVFPCRHFTTYWPQPAEVYRGNLSVTLKQPVLLIAETYDPATPLRNGRRLAQEMGHQNARLIAHHGYGHSSVDTSNCTDTIARDYILHGKLPDEPETACYANEKPYLYGVGQNKTAGAAGNLEDPVKVWREHLGNYRF
ncbi:hypothetical protein B0T19DRAFT_434050 [Cercophora scortea]|uniref:AB hydrolase-1 domain-containing protein n=1 Tax=Cercophora scortea TaxID=314031 RepID=A0AAE0M5N1_9PEZI|nr:hypothetical protein B0T19DRAFT_434050 [Cercophora scortea]